MSSQTTYIISKPTNWQLFSSISQVWLLYETWGYYNKFESMKSLWVCYWYVKMSQCGCVEHGLAYITFYVQKHITYLVALFWFPAAILNFLFLDYKFSLVMKVQTSVAHYLHLWVESWWLWMIYNCNSLIAHCCHFPLGGGILVDHWATISIWN